MHTLLLRLIAPMQSWGTQSKYSLRDTQNEPSKSGVIGLLCAAKGESRGNTSFITSLTHSLTMGVRVDCEGRKLYDYHTARNIISANEEKQDRSAVGNRYYLADASFLVGLESDDHDLLKELQHELANPYWPLYLGRKSFIPSYPVYLKDGLRRSSRLLDTLRTYPWLGRTWQRRPTQLRFIIEHRTGEPEPADQPISQVEDQPVCFDILNRHYFPRRVRTSLESPDTAIFSHQEA